MIWYIIIGVVIGLITTLIICRIVPAQKVKTINAEIEQQEQELFKRIHEQEDIREQLIKDTNLYTHEKDKLQLEIIQLQRTQTMLNQNIAESNNNLEILRDKADQTAKAFYEEKMLLAAEQFAHALEDKANEYRQAEDDCKSTYLLLLEEAKQQYQDALSQQRNYIAQVKQDYDNELYKLQDLQSKIEAAISADQRAEMETQKKAFYQLSVSQADLVEIQQLRNIIPQFRNPRSICKIIWESYYRNSCSDLINRIIPKDKVTGIYKITNILNGMSYIGQARDITERIKQHVKCGIGIDAPVNKLYTAMQKDGVNNFMFEIIETCPNEKLNEREKFWIDFYKTQEWGYNMTKGGARE